jgi:hypothetical protein
MMASSTNARYAIRLVCHWSTFSWIETRAQIQERQLAAKQKQVQEVHVSDMLLRKAEASIEAAG